MLGIGISPFMKMRKSHSKAFFNPRIVPHFSHCSNALSSSEKDMITSQIRFLISFSFFKFITSSSHNASQPNISDLTSLYLAIKVSFP